MNRAIARGLLIPILACAVFAFTSGNAALADPEPPGLSLLNEDRSTTASDELAAALAWLADHQDDDGSWSPDEFDAAGEDSGREGDYANLDGSDSVGWANSGLYVTALATLAFLCVGDTELEHLYQDEVRAAIRWITSNGNGDGTIGRSNDANYNYGHAFAIMALAEAYTAGGALIDPDLDVESTLEAAVGYLARAQNVDSEGPLGWRYGVRSGDNDSSVTGHAVLALKAAEAAGIEVPEECWEGAERWFDSVTTDVRGKPRTGYIQPGGPAARMMATQRFVAKPEMEAIHIACANLLGTSDEDTLEEQADLLRDELPTCEDPFRIDYRYWFFGTLGMIQMGKRYWKDWSKEIEDALIDSQRTDGDEESATYGSWDSASCWGPVGGRVACTALACLTLEIFYSDD